MKKQTLIYILSLLFITNIFSQEIGTNKYGMQYYKGEIIVQLKKNFTDTDQIIENTKTINGVETNLELLEILSKTMNIWHFKFNSSLNHDDFVNKLTKNRNIIEVQYNYLIENRATTPNDPSFSQQWQYINTGGSGGIVGADIDADLAWDITTGGLTPDGDTIVLCVVDDGILDTHEDLEENLWKNYNEIPNNGIDDDNNGYIDDFYGYNANSNNDNIFTSGYSHGNAVAGVAGAKGNNGIGVAGINWDVKIMLVKNSGIDQAQVIKAYSYPLDMRVLYNNTNGAKGAFVVSVNSSWGIDYGQPSTVPLWCAFYDEMGAAGILNCGATANAAINVDVDGDLPTACSSDYLITVTNIWRDDQKINSAGYGATTIDIGAFGEEAYTLSQFSTNAYGGFGGTSGATPQVTGAIALLYSAPCQSFATLSKSDPDLAALKAKEYIMNGTDANTSLQGITVSGGRLNLNGMLTQLNDECVNCPSVENFVITNINDLNATVLITVDGDVSQVQSYEVRYRVSGTTNWLTKSSSSNSILMENLNANTTYDYQVKIDCDQAGTYTTSKTFTTNALSINILAIANGIEVYPSPVKDIVYINLTELQDNFEIYFYDISGKLLYEGKMLTKRKKIDISVLNNGIYILKLKDKNGNVYSHKVNKL